MQRNDRMLAAGYAAMFAGFTCLIVGFDHRDRRTTDFDLTALCVLLAALLSAMLRPR